ncbi:MAG TPA: response regulator [Thermoanaerobaculia bacterium]|nr:response regulator [Thermoanaerobaculia bacterium]
MTLPILIVDDDVPTQNLLRALLGRFGHVTEVAGNGSEAIDLLRRRNYSLIILDLMMPVVAGHAVVAFLDETSRRIPVVVCTAARGAATEHLDPKIVKALIHKPFDIEQLVGTVNGLVGAQGPLARVLVVDDDLRARYIMRAFLDPADVTEAETGDAALELIGRTRPDLVLLDLTLPGTPGEEVLRKIRETVETSDIPVVIVTSRQVGEADRAKLLEHAAAVIYKGDLSRETLRQALQAIKR